MMSNAEAGNAIQTVDGAVKKVSEYRSAFDMFDANCCRCGIDQRKIDALSGIGSRLNPEKGRFIRDYSWR